MIDPPRPPARSGEGACLENDDRPEGAPPDGWPERLPGAPAYRYPWLHAEERQWALAFRDVYSTTQGGVCPHCRLRYVPAPLERVDRFHGGGDRQQYAGDYRCPRPRCWGLSAAIFVASGTLLWPVAESPHRRETLGIPVSAAEVAEYEARSRQDAAEQHQAAARELASAVEATADLPDQIEDAIPEFLRRGRERRRPKHTAQSAPAPLPSREEAARGL